MQTRLTQRPVRETVEQSSVYQAGDLFFRKAGTNDDEQLRALLCDNSMPSWVELAITREPSYFAGEGLIGDSESVLALDKRHASAVVGMYSCVSMPVHLNGHASTAAYLGGLRVSPGYRRKIRVLKEGFNSIPVLMPQYQIWFTSIAGENSNARRLLEAGLPSMPRYRMLGELETVAIATRKARAGKLLKPAEARDIPALIDFFNGKTAAYQFSPVLKREWLSNLSGMHGLHLHDFFLLKHRRRIAAVLAVWDQRSFRQIVARAYRFPINALRPMYNLIAGITGRTKLPRTGQTLQQVFLSFFSFDQTMQVDPVDVIREALSVAKAKGAQSALIGFNAANPLLNRIKKHFHTYTYRTCIEQVEWPREQSPFLDKRPVQPEIALL
jgi:hypothetical protein